MNKVFLLAFLLVLAVWVRYDPAVTGNFLEVDGYYWHELSHSPLAVKLGAAPNMLRLAPQGVVEQKNLHTVLTDGMSCIQLYAYHIFLVLVLGVILYRIEGFILLMVVLYAPIIIARTAIGWNDTDIYVLIFTTLAVWSMQTKRYLEAGLWVFFLSFFWQGWVFIGALTGIGIVLHREKGWRKYGVGLLFACMAYSNQVIDIFKIIPSTGWPSGLSSTAEMMAPSMHKILALLNPMSAWFFLTGILVMLWRRKWFLPIISLICLVMVFWGERFLLPAVPIWALASCRGLQSLHFLRRLAPLITASCIIGLGLGGLSAKEMHRYILLVDSGWVQSCQYIHDKLPKDSVLVSWWSAGHVMADLGQRQVAIDGGTQHLPRVFWIARALTTNDLRETRTICSYLVNFGDEQINELVDLDTPWKEILRKMESRLTRAPYLRPCYLLVYKEMFLNYGSIKGIAEWFVKKYPEHQIPGLGSTIYCQLFTGRFDNTFKSEYTYNDGKNCIKIWRLDE